MITLKEYIELLEAFDRPYKWTFHSGGFEYRFTTNSGLDYYASYSDGTYRSIESEDGKEYYDRYEFKFTYSDEEAGMRGVNPTMMMSKKNDPRVFATIVDILKDITKKPYIDIIDVSGSTDKRTSLYMRMAEKLLPKLNTNFHMYKDPRKNSLWLIRNGLNLDDRRVMENL